jgi:group I intron endonuclease
MKVSGIYVIENMLNGKMYVGSSKDIYARLREHKSKLRLKKHVNSKLQNAFSKYGEECFYFYTLAEVPIDDLLAVEQYFIDWLEVCTYGYNIADIAGKPPGIKWDEHYKRMLSERLKGVKFTPEHRLAMSISSKGKNLGKKASVETREKMSEMRKGTKNNFYGKRHDNDTKKSIGEKSRYRCNKLTKEQVIEIRGLIASGITNTEIAIRFNINQSSVSNIKAGKSWTHVV